MRSTDFASQLYLKAKNRKDVLVERFLLRHGVKEYNFLRIASRNFRNGFRQKCWMNITAGFHGDEKAGSLTILDRFNEIVDFAHSYGVGLIIYPLINPSGFDADTRYNISGDRGQSGIGNNEFCRYRLKDGRIVDDLENGMDFEEWLASSRAGESRPVETVRLNTCIDCDLRYQKNILAALDIHQDRYIKGPAAYQYAFGDLSRYGSIVKEVKKTAVILKNTDVDSGQNSAVRTDAEGFIVRHDGSITDYLHRLGVDHTIALETTTDTLLEKAIEINMIWIRGLIRLIV